MIKLLIVVATLLLFVTILVDAKKAPACGNNIAESNTIVDPNTRQIFETILLYRSLYIGWEEQSGHTKAISLLKTNHNFVQKFNSASIAIERAAFKKPGFGAAFADGLRSLADDFEKNSTNQYEIRNTFDSLKQLIIMADPEFYYRK